MHRLVRLQVEGKLRHAGYLLQRHVLEARLVVFIVATVAQQELLVLVVRLVGKERIVERLLQSVELAALHLEGLRFVLAAPATVDGNVHLLGKVAVRVAETAVVDELKAGRAFPVHVEVALRVVLVGRLAVRARHVDAYGVVVQVVRVGDEGDDRQVVFLVLEDVGTRRHLAGQVALLEEAEAEHRGGADVEEAVRAGQAVVGIGRGAIDGIAQRGSLRDADPHAQTAREELSREICLGSCQLYRGKRHARVALARRGRVAEIPVAASILRAGIRAAHHGSGVVLLQDEVALGVGDIERAALTVQLHVQLRVGPALTDVLARVSMVEPQRAESPGRHLAHLLVDEGLLQVVGVIAHPASRQRDLLVGGVVEFEETSVVPGRIHKSIHIGRHDLIGQHVASLCRGSLHDGHLAVELQFPVVQAHPVLADEDLLAYADGHLPVAAHDNVLDHVLVVTCLKPPVGGLHVVGHMVARGSPSAAVRHLRCATPQTLGQGTAAQMGQGSLVVVRAGGGIDDGVAVRVVPTQVVGVVLLRRTAAVESLQAQAIAARGQVSKRLVGVERLVPVLGILHGVGGSEGSACPS